MLEEIQKQIIAAEQNAVRIDTEISTLRKGLDEARAQQATANLKGIPTGDIDNEVMTLKGKLEGLLQAQGKQAVEISTLRESEKKELANIKRAQGDAITNDCERLIKEIYSQQLECTSKIRELQAKSREYVVLMGRSGKYSDFSTNLQHEFPVFLANFPRDIFLSGDLPKPDEIRHSLIK